MFTLLSSNIFSQAQYPTGRGCRLGSNDPLRCSKCVFKNKTAAETQMTSTDRRTVANIICEGTVASKGVEASKGNNCLWISSNGNSDIEGRCTDPENCSYDTKLKPYIENGVCIATITNCSKDFSSVNGTVQFLLGRAKAKIQCPLINRICPTTPNYCAFTASPPPTAGAGGSAIEKSKELPTINRTGSGNSNQAGSGQ